MGGSWSPLLGVLLGALVTLVVQRMTLRSQKDREKREVLRSIAARTISASRETWTMLRAHAIHTPTSPDTAHDYLWRYTEANEALDLALDELTLMEGSVEKQATALREAVKLGTLLPGRQHHDQHESRERVFWEAHESLHASLAPLVRP